MVILLATYVIVFLFLISHAYLLLGGKGECSSSGLSNSVTGRRGRRSVDDFLPEDDPSHSAFVNSPSILYTSAGDSRVNKTTIEETPRLLKRNEELEKQDERIEGLETLLANLQRAMKVRCLSFYL